MDKILIYIGIVAINILFIFVYQAFFYFDDKREEDITGGIVKRTWFKCIFTITKIFNHFSKKNKQDEKDKIIKMDLIKGILIIFIITKILNYLIDSYTIENENTIIKSFESLINITQSLDIYLGIISVLVTIYIYSISLGDDFKKYILLILLGEGKVLYLIILILLFYSFNISPVLFISLILIVFYELSTMIEKIFRVMNAVFFKKNWKEKIIPKITLKNLENIYYELRKRITKAMIEKDFITFEEMISYYKALLMTDRFEVPKETDKEIKNNNEEKYPAIRFLNDIYTYLLENPDDNLFKEINYLNIELGKYYLKKDDLNMAGAYYNIIVRKYKYLKNTNKTNIEIEEELFLGIRHYVFDELSEEQKVIILKSILRLFYEMIKNNELDKIYRYQEIFGRENQNDSFKEYPRIILIFLLQRKLKITKDNIISQKIEELKEKIETRYIDKLDILEEIYSKIVYWNKMYDLLEFSLGEPDIFGFSIGTYSDNDQRNIVLEILNKYHYFWLSKEFILNNYEMLETKINELKLENLKKRMENFSYDIKIKKAEKISKIRLKEKSILLEEIKQFEEEETKFFKLFKKNMGCLFKTKNLTKELNLEKDYLIINKIYPNNFLNDSFIEIVNLYIDELNELCLKKELMRKAKKINLKEVKKLKKDNYFIGLGNIDFEELDRLDILTYYLEDDIDNRVFLINKDSIKEIVFYLPEGYSNLKYTYLEIEPLEDNNNPEIFNDIPGETQEEKELIKKGSSRLKIAKKMEIIFKDNAEIYEIVIEEEKNS